MSMIVHYLRIGLTGPRCVSRVGFAWIAPLLFLRNLQFLTPQFIGDVWVFMLTALFGVLCSGITLWISASLLLRNRTRAPVNPWLTLLCFLLTGIANSFALRGADSRGMGPAHIGATGGLIQSTLFVTVWLVVAATIANSLARHSEISQALRVEKSELKSTREQAQTTLVDFSRKLADRVLMELIPTLNKLIKDARSLMENHSPAGIDAFIDRLRIVAHDSIRPIAHELRQSRGAGSIAVPDAPKVRGRRRNLFAAATRLAVTSDPIRPVGATAANMAVVLLASPAPQLVLRYFIFSVPMSLAVLFGIRALIPVSVWRRSLPQSMLFLSVAYALSGAISVLSLPLVQLTPFAQQTQNEDAVWQLLAIPLALCGLASGWGWSLGRGVAMRLDQENRDLEAAVVTQQWEVNQLGASIDEVQQRVSHVVHTDVQGAVAGCAVVLERARDQPDSSMPAALRQVEQHLELTVSRLQTAMAGDEVAQFNVRDGLRQVAEAWHGIIEVEVSMDQATEASINQSGSLSRSVVDIVSEAASNATIHGFARSAVVELTEREGTLTIIVTDDGIGPPTEQRAQSGLAELAATSTALALLPREDGGAVLRVDLPAASAEFHNEDYINSLAP